MKPQKVTESDSHYGDLEKKSALELVQIINAEDTKVANAVAQTLPEIAELVERVLPRFLSGETFLYRSWHLRSSGHLGCF